MSKIYVAFYKHKRPCNNVRNTIYRIVDEIIKLFSKGKYSHCEIAVDIGNNNYNCYTSSNLDGGVRCKVMPLPTERWDLVEINNIAYSDIRQFYKKTLGCKYDFFGAVGVILKFGNNKKRYFCSEWCAELLKLQNPHKISPVKLHKILTTHNK